VSREKRKVQWTFRPGERRSGAVTRREAGTTVDERKADVVGGESGWSCLLGRSTRHARPG